ncbi:MAG TPA: HEAT repeat domain-containing protein [Planctomycetes bacterium]|nr:HEAT repeat domain-containing protein [Planctomycetota bacterium]
MLSSTLLVCSLLLPQGGDAGVQGWELLPPPPFGGLQPPSISEDDGGEVDPGAGPGASGGGSGGDGTDANPGGSTGSEGAGGSFPGEAGPVGAENGRPPSPFAPSAAVSSAPTSGTSGYALELDLWPIWWRLQREVYLTPSPWPLSPTTGRGFALAGDDAPGPSVTTALAQGRLVPALLEALENDPSSVERAAILLALARIGEEHPFELGPSKLQDLLLTALADGNRNVAETACISLGVLGRPAALSPLSALLADDEAGRKLVHGRHVSVRMRSFAALSIGLIAARTSNLDVARFAASALRENLERDPGPSPDLHVASLVALGAIGPIEDARLCDSVALLLLRLMSSRRESVEARAQVPPALGSLWPGLGAETREKVLRTLLDGSLRRSERDLIRQGCALALGRIGDRGESDASRAVRRRLTELASGGDQRLRAIALLGLARVVTRPVPPGAKAQAGPQGHALKDALRFLERRLGHARFDDEAWIALALGLLQHGQNALGERVGSDIPFILREGMRRAPSPTIRTAYAIALGFTGDAKSVSALERVLEEVDPDRRALAAEALGMSGSPGAIEPLRKLLEASEHRPRTLASAARALTLLHDPELVERLGRIRERAPGSFAGQGVTRALGLSRHPDAADTLLQQLVDPRATALDRAHAAVGIGLLAQKERTDWSALLSFDLHYRAAPSILLGSDRGGILDLP